MTLLCPGLLLATQLRYSVALWIPELVKDHQVTFPRGYAFYESDTTYESTAIFGIVQLRL